MKADVKLTKDEIAALWALYRNLKGATVAIERVLPMRERTTGDENKGTGDRT